MKFNFIYKKTYLKNMIFLFNTREKKDGFSQKKVLKLDFFCLLG